MAITNKATIIQWNDEKCFGFAVANGVKYIVHLNSLRNLTRSPRIGDTIVVYSFGKSEKGPRIESGVLESSMPGMSAEDIVRKLGKSSRVKVRLAVLCLRFAFCWRWLGVHGPLPVNWALCLPKSAFTLNRAKTFLNTRQGTRLLGIFAITVICRQTM